MFRAHFDQLVRGVSQQLDMTMMTFELYSKHLISEDVKDYITTTFGLSSLQKSSTLVNAIEKQIAVDQRPVQSIQVLCEVMRQYSTRLAHVAESIREALGELMNV